MNVWAVLGAALAPLLLMVVEWMKTGEAKHDGAAIEAGKTSAATAAAQTAIAQAEAAAPDTKAAVIDRLKKGTF